ncbi:MAG: alpha/beta fold hydrolase [Oscillochloridaceae bacterium umkhey_bin13]
MKAKFQTRSYDPTREGQGQAFARAGKTTKTECDTQAHRPASCTANNVVAEATLVDAHGQFVEVSGRRIYYLHWPAHGPNIVLIHGFGTANTSWNTVGPLLARAGYATYALDLGGFGLSSKAWEANYGHPEQADLVAAWMEHLGLDSALIVGHSMGGNVAAHLALRHPQRVATLVLAAPAILSGLVTTPRQLSGLVKVPALRLAARLAVRWIIKRSDFSQFEASNPQVLRVLRTADWDQALVATARDSWANQLTPEQLGSINVKTLLIWGTNDQTIPVTDSVRLKALLPDAHFISMPGSGHMAHEEDPHSFVAHALSALTNRATWPISPFAKSA